MIIEVQQASGWLDWLQALAAPIAILALAFEIFKSRKERTQARQDLQLSMARSVSVTSHLEQQDDAGIEYVVRYKVKNYGSYPVDDLKLVVSDWRRIDEDDPYPANVLELVFGTVLPGEVESGAETVSFSSTPGSFRFTNGPAHVHFVDVWGQAWDRGPGACEKLEAPSPVC